MKRFGIVAMLVVLLAGCASMGPVQDTSIVKIIETGKPKDEAFDLTMRWMSQAFTSSKAVIEYSDKAAGTINGNGVMTVPGGLGIPVDVRFSIIIDLKDSKARLSLRALSVNHNGSSPSAVYPPIFDEFVNGVDDMAASYKAFLTTPSSDW